MRSKRRATAFAADDLMCEKARLSVLAAMIIDMSMKHAKINQAELARRSGISEPRITLILQGAENITLETLARLGLATGAYWRLEKILPPRIWNKAKPEAERADQLRHTNSDESAVVVKSGRGDGGYGVFVRRGVDEAGRGRVQAVKVVFIRQSEGATTVSKKKKSKASK